MLKMLNSPGIQSSDGNAHLEDIDIDARPIVRILFQADVNWRVI